LLRNDQTWAIAFEEDDHEVVYGDQGLRLNVSDPEGDDELNLARSAILPRKLPAEVSLMNYTELWKWLGTKIIKEHWAKGGTSKCVKFGNPDFEPSFWLPEIWGWENVNKHPRSLSKSSFDGLGNMTEYLKKVVMKRLDLLGINVSEWVSQEFTMEEKKRRERNRKKSTPSVVETIAENIHDDEHSVNGKHPIWKMVILRMLLWKKIRMRAL
jgi:hypothetical protein